MNDYLSIVKKIIEEINPYIDIDEETELLESGILDSLAIVYIVTQMEDKYEIHIDESEIIPKNFRTVNSICNLLRRK